MLPERYESGHRPSGAQATADADPRSTAQAKALRRLFEAGADVHFTIELGGDGGYRVVDAEDGEPLRALLATDVVKRFARDAARAGEPITRRTGPLATLEGRDVELRLVPLAPSARTDATFVTGAARAIPTADLSDPADDVFYQSILQGPTALFITRLADGVLVDANEKFTALTGYEREDALGVSTLDLGLWPDASGRERLVRRLRTGEAIVDEEFALRRRDGALRIVLGSLQPLTVHGEECVLSNVIDVTDERDAAEGARESRALLDKVFDASPAGMMIHLADDGELVSVNRAWSRLTGVDAGQAVGRDVWSLGLWPEDNGTAAFRARVAEEETLHDVELTLRRPDERVLTVLASTQRIEVQGAEAVLTVLRDITERKRVEIELVAAKEEAENSVRMKNAFLTNMTHEVRTPLTVILGFTSMLRQGVRPEYRRFVRVIERSGRRLLLMLDSILDLAQLEAGALEVVAENVNVVSAVEHVVGEARPLAEEKALTLDVALPSEPHYAHVDHRLLLRVLTHVLDNAIKFTDEGTVSVGLEADASTLVIHVRDTGVGIEPGFLPHLFEEFAQESTGLERTHQGSGLGLTVAQRLVRLLGGTIRVESRKGEGSQFSIVLPREDGA